MRWRGYKGLEQCLGATLRVICARLVMVSEHHEIENLASELNYIRIITLSHALNPPS